MFSHLHSVAAGVFVFFFAFVTVLGFLAATWKRGDLASLGEWGLGGRQFGRWVTWFLLGGDLYTAYTVIAVPAKIYSEGAIGFFAIPYTIIIYPFLYLTMPRLWAVSHKHHYVTAADFVRGRYGHPMLEFVVALTGIVATMPYIALQLVGLEKVIAALGFGGQGIWAHVPITVAFLILALYTYRSGLRAPALIAFVKDTMIYIFIFAAVVIIPYKLGGWGEIFHAAGVAYDAKLAMHKVAMAGLTLAPGQIVPYVTLALGSAMALFMYPHALTATLSASSASAIRFNTMTLPAYSFVLGLIALLGMMAIAAGIPVDSSSDAVPRLVMWAFPEAFAGFCLSAIALGALVPAAVMAIGAANTFTRNIWKPFVHNRISPSEEAFVAKIVSLFVKIGALGVIFCMPTQFALDLQLLGGVWMIQIFPAMVFGLFTRWFSGSALCIGWFVGIVVGTNLSRIGQSWVPVHAILGEISAYNGLIAVILNICVAGLLTYLLPFSRGVDETRPEDYRG